MVSEVLTFEQFAIREGAGTGDMGEAGLHKTSRRFSPKQVAKMVRTQWERDVQWQARRDAARDAYDAAVAEGTIRPPTRWERLEAAATGHPDNESVQAARRILAAAGRLPISIEENACQ